MTFSFERVRFRIAVQAELRFPAPLPANVLRGALGTVLLRRPSEYARIFAPASENGPSGLTQRPRPFVFRAAHLVGATIDPGQEFFFDLHVFDPELVPQFIDAFSEVMNEGLGATRSPVRLLQVSRERIEVSLEPAQARRRAFVEFATPTELKHEGQLAEEPRFDVLISLARTRLLNVSNLRSNNLSSRWLDASRAVQMVKSDLQRVQATRFSTRTGQRHPIGGFTGTVTYEGDLTMFLPYLQAAQYIGVGRQTTWGKGELRISL